MKRSGYFIFLLLFLGSIALKAQGFYNTNQLQKIEIKFTQSNWDYILDTAKAGKDGYLVSEWVKINGIQYDSSGVKYKGNSSFNPNNLKNPFHIELNYIKGGQDHEGYRDIKLSNGFKDPSFVREVLSYNILNKYMPSPLSNFAQVYVNGAYIGVYSNSEPVNKTFCDSRFYSKDNAFFFMDNPGCGLKYNGPDSSGYAMYTIKSTTGWKTLINLCDTLNNKPSFIESILDVDKTFWMLAFDNLLVNLDSYIGQPMHNYYMYRDDNGRFNPVVWDVNEAFGNFTNVGGPGPVPPLTIAQEQSLSTMIHSTDANWPLISKLLVVPQYKRMYIAHMRTIMNENFVNGSYTTTALSLQNVIDTALTSDMNKFYSKTQFTANINSNVTTTMPTNTIVGLSVLMDGRLSYLQSTPEFTAVPPTIASPSAAMTPSLNAAITITANITNADLNGVYLGYRFAVTEKFNKVGMFDDGLHSDGTAGDNVFGGTFTMSATSAQYYIYAENINAGMFSPERAEHEFHSLVAIQTATAGQVYINEFLADNLSDVYNENFQYEDWIELYNTHSNPLELSGIYLTDDYSNPTKFMFPQNTVIPANGFLIVWADNDASTASYVHANFKLGAAGEQLMLRTAAGVVLDSVTFGPQTSDKSMARCPNGTGSFSVGTTPTFKLSNCAVGVNELKGENESVRIYPNPADHFILVMNNFTKPEELKVYNTIGQQIHTATISGNHKINTEHWQDGVYFIRVKDTVRKLVINH
jgi:hypothetical protein